MWRSLLNQWHLCECLILVAWPSYSFGVDSLITLVYWTIHDIVFVLTIHTRQYKLAADPRWLTISDALGLSCIPNSIGATTSTSWCMCASYVVIPVVSSCTRSGMTGLIISKTSTLFEQVSKWMFCICVFSALGNPVVMMVFIIRLFVALNLFVPAKRIHQLLNLFHFFDLLPLVSSEYSMSGTITMGFPLAFDLRWCTRLRSLYSYQWSV